MGRVSNVGLLVEELGCQVGSLPRPYLGFSLGVHRKSQTGWMKASGRGQHYGKDIVYFQRRENYAN